jgi:hypothetical protein
MAKFKIGGSGGDGNGAGWIGNVFFEKADMCYETDDAGMIELLHKSGVATEIKELEPVVPDATAPLQELLNKTKDELTEICKELQIGVKRTKQDMIDAIMAELTKGQG